jgi:tetratricopeptide (TPR) repeat protein
VRSTYEARVCAAGVIGALVAFLVAASSDWIWQVPALPAAFLLLAAAVLAPGSTRRRGLARGVSRSVRLGAAALAVASLVAIAVPLATVSKVRASQAAVVSGDPARALADARAAARLDPDAASAEVQLALVLELQRDIPGALAAAHRAASDEPSNWSTWLVVSRLEAEAGRPAASLAAYQRSRALNPRSPLFRQ